MVAIKSFLTEVLRDHFKVLYVYLNEGDKVGECYSRVKLMIETNLHVGFFTITFFKHFLLKRIYWYIKLLNYLKIINCIALKVENNIEDLCMVTIENSELAITIITYFSNERQTYDFPNFTALHDLHHKTIVWTGIKQGLFYILRVWVRFFRGHRLKKAILFACTHETDAIFNHS